MLIFNVQVIFLYLFILIAIYYKVIFLSQSNFNFIHFKTKFKIVLKLLHLYQDNMCCMI